jgi:hypothetical protein
MMQSSPHTDPLPLIPHVMPSRPRIQLWVVSAAVEMVPWGLPYLAMQLSSLLVFPCHLTTHNDPYPLASLPFPRPRLMYLHTGGR